jgi:broad specificity phosphatase PhoE
VSRLPPVIFVRHGETDWNRQGLIQGAQDIPLNQHGLSQARQVAKALARIEGINGYGLAVSPMQRTRMTMAAVTSALGVSDDRAGKDDRLKELAFGIWEGKPFWELKASPVYPADPESRYDWRPEGGESYADGRVRVESWLTTLAGPTLVVSHGALGRCLIGHVCGLGPAQLVSLKTPQGCYCRLENGNAHWFDATGDAA